MAVDENESPTAAWRAAVREREAADLARLHQQFEDYKAGKRWPIHGANWDDESLGLVPPKPRPTPSAPPDKPAAQTTEVSQPAAAIARQLAASTKVTRTPERMAKLCRQIEADESRIRAECRSNGVPYQAAWTTYVQEQRRRAWAHYAGLERSYPIGLYSDEVDLQALATAFGVDARWTKAVRADRDRVKAAIEAGHPADWRQVDLSISSFFTYDDYDKIPGETVNQQRYLEYARVLEEAAADVQRATEWYAERAAAEVLKRKLAGRIPLTGSAAGIVFGTLVDGGEDLVIPLRKMQHQLVVGTTGYGKSVYLHGLIQQLLASPEVERVVLIDLKEGGVTFARYRTHPKAMVVWQFSAIQVVITQVLDLMRQRGEQMSAQGVEVWRGQRVVVIVDEFADIQAEIGMAENQEEKAAGKRLIHNLTRISQRARSFGILLVCAMQRPSADSIDASLRANLPCRICFRVNTSAMAASVLDGLDDAPVRPQHLPKGRYIYYDGGRQKLVQAHVAPGIDLGD